MKNVFNIITIYVFLIAPTQVMAQTFELEIIDSLTKAPIENVYLYDDSRNFISVSNRNGVCNISLEDSIAVKYEKRINISHIGYNNKTIDIILPKTNNRIKVLLCPRIFDLSEVVISTPNADNIVKKAIENIPKNYLSLKGDTLAMDLSFVFFDNPDSKVANFRGNVAITSDGNYLFAAKYATKNDVINESYYSYSNEISPSGFYSIIFIQNHAPIRTSKKIDFYYDGTITSQGNDAYKISFSRKSKYNNLKGYMLINVNDYAITYISYEIGPIKKWIAATQKSKGLIYTNLRHYKVNVSYSKNVEHYKFSEGAVNMLFNRTKKKKLLSNNTYDVSVTAIEKSQIPNGLIYLKGNELFKKK